MKTKVAIINSLGAHGSSFHLYLYGQAYGLKESGVDVSIYTNNVTNDPGYIGVDFFSFYKNIFSSRFKIISARRYIIGSIHSIFHAKLHGVKICHYHIFHINILVFFDLILTKLLRMKVVYTVHDVISFDNKSSNSRLSRWIYQKANKILTHNKFSSDIFRSYYSGLNISAEIIPHGNYIQFLNDVPNKLSSRERLGLEENKKVLLFFGMIKKVKGLEILLKSLKEVIKNNPDIFLVIAGRVWKNDFSEYQKIIDKNNLQKYCLLHNNFIKHEDVDYYYSCADLVVMPYMRIYQSGVLLMSMSYKTPVLVSDLPPLTEVITDNKTGFVFETGNYRSLAKKINNIFSNLENLDRVTNNALELVNRKYDWREIGKNLKKVYESI